MEDERKPLENKAQSVMEKFLLVRGVFDCLNWNGPSLDDGDHGIERHPQDQDGQG